MPQKYLYLLLYLYSSRSTTVVLGRSKDVLKHEFISYFTNAEFLDIGLAHQLDPEFDYRLNNELYFDAAIQRTNTIDLTTLLKISQALTQNFQNELKSLADSFPKESKESIEFQHWWQNMGTSGLTSFG